MLTFLFIVLFLIWMACSAFLVLVILNQEPKGGGIGGIFAQGGALGDTFGSPGQKELRAFTRFSATVYFVLTILLVMLGPAAFKPHARIAPPPVAEKTVAEQAAASAAARTGALEDAEAGLVVVEDAETAAPAGEIPEAAPASEAEVAPEAAAPADAAAADAAAAPEAPVADEAATTQE
jgi:protein translocase SecG subunit